MSTNPRRNIQAKRARKRREKRRVWYKKIWQSAQTGSDFFGMSKHKVFTDLTEFGICDDIQQPLKPAYIDIASRGTAIVENPNNQSIIFIPIDHCNEYDFRRDDGKQDRRCDGVLTMNNHSDVIFVELKEKAGKARSWIPDGEEQLRSTIRHFSKCKDSNNLQSKRAYIANKLHPLVPRGQATRIEKFKNDTNGYILRIQNRIVIETHYYE